MLALLAAMTIAAAPEPAAVRPKAFLLQPPASGPIACKPHGRYQADWTDPALARPDTRINARRLKDLPKPNLEKAVMRTVGGCAVPVVVSYSIGP